MGPKGARREPVNGTQREFINNAWLSGMTMVECGRHITQLFGKEAVLGYVPLLWALRSEQMGVFDDEVES